MLKNAIRLKQDSSREFLWRGRWGNYLDTFSSQSTWSCNPKEPARLLADILGKLQLIKPGRCNPVER